MKLFFDKCRPNFFYRLYLDERTGYANGHNYSGMKPIKIALSKLSARGGGNGFFCSFGWHHNNVRIKF